MFYCPLHLHSNTSYKEAHAFSFSRYHPAGVAAVVYSLKHNLLVVAGFKGDEPSLDEPGEIDHALYNYPSLKSTIQCVVSRFTRVFPRI